MRGRETEDEGEWVVGGWLPEALDISPADVEQWRPAILLITASIPSYFFLLLCLMFFVLSLLSFSLSIYLRFLNRLIS